MEEPGLAQTLSFGQLEAAVRRKKIKKRSKWGQFEDGEGTSDAAPAGAKPNFSEMTENQQIAYAMRMSVGTPTEGEAEKLTIN